ATTGSATEDSAICGEDTCGTRQRTPLPRRSSLQPNTWTNLTGRGSPMKKLLISKKVFDQIVSSVLETPEGLETGVTLFGTSLAGIHALDQKMTQPDSGCIVLAIA